MICFYYIGHSYFFEPIKNIIIIGFSLERRSGVRDFTSERKEMQATTSEKEEMVAAGGRAMKE